MIIGLTGQAGAGKSTAAALLAASGAQIIDADRLGHAALADGAVQTALCGVFGGEIFYKENGVQYVDRKRLAAAVFADAEKLAFLESVSHPWIRARIMDACAGADAGLTVVDAALLKALQMDAYFTRILLITAPFSLRLSRVQGRGWDTGELRRRDQALAGRLYTAAAPKVAEIVNDGDRETLRKKITACGIALAGNGQIDE